MTITSLAFVTGCAALFPVSPGLAQSNAILAGKVILVGQSAALTGSQAEFGKDVRRVELVTLDDGGNEARAKENSTRLIDEHRVVSLFGYIAPFSGTPALYRFDLYVFTIGASYDDELAGMVRQLVMATAGPVRAEAGGPDRPGPHFGRSRHASERADPVQP